MSSTDEQRILDALEQVSQVEPAPEATTRAIERARQSLQAVSATPSAKRRRRFMRSPMLKWLLPAAAAAAVLIGVGLWPEQGGNGRPGGSGRVYALSEVPSLIAGARTLHVRLLHYPPIWAPPEQEREVWVRDYWVDQPSLSWCWRSTYMGKRSEQSPGDSEGQHKEVDRICDGQYVMIVDHRDKTVTYEKPTPFKLRYQVRHERDNLTPLTAESLENWTHVGQEPLDGRMHQTWDLVIPPYGDGRSFHHRLWFSPDKGEVSRIQYWAQSPNTNGQWVEAGVFERFERDVAPPPGTFSTEPPADYRLVNTKETAEPDTLDTCSVFGRVGARTAYGHVTYELPGRVLLFAVSCIEKGKDPAAQAGLFENLVPGGPLPKLPLEIHTLLPTHRTGTLAWHGFHLAHTHKGGRHYEWTLYVPNQAAPRSGIPSYEGEYRVHTAGPAEPDPELRVSWGAGDPLDIRNDADFNEFVLGAMAELSDAGIAPQGITYDDVMNLSRQLRESLKNQPAPLKTP